MLTPRCLTEWQSGEAGCGPRRVKPSTTSLPMSSSERWRHWRPAQWRAGTPSTAGSAEAARTSAAEQTRWLGVLLVKRLITPPPPRLVAIDVEKELRNLLALRVPKRHGV